MAIDLRHGRPLGPVQVPVTEKTIYANAMVDVVAGHTHRLPNAHVLQIVIPEQAKAIVIPADTAFFRSLERQCKGAADIGESTDKTIGG